MKKLKYIFLITLMIFGSNLFSQNLFQNDTLRPFLRHKFKVTIIDEMKGDSLAIITKPYLVNLYKKIKLQAEIIESYSNHDEFIKQLNLLVEGLRTENYKMGEIITNNNQEIKALKELNETEKKSTQFERDRYNKAFDLYKKEHKKNNLLKIVGYIGVPLGFVIGILLN